MKVFQNSRAAAHVPEPPTKNPSPAVRPHAELPRAPRHIHPTAPPFPRHPAAPRTIFLINGQIIRIPCNPLKTNNGTHF